MELIIGRQGNQCFPIEDPSVSRKHCRLRVNPDGSYVIENISQAGTKVNGIPVISKIVVPEDIVQLGPVFSFKIKDLNLGCGVEDDEATIITPSRPQTATAPRNVADKKSTPAEQRVIKDAGNVSDNLPKKPGNEYSIDHLKMVWDKFNDTNISMAHEQRRINLIRTRLGIFTMCAMPTIFFLGPIGYILTFIGVIGNIYSYTKMKNAETPEQRLKRQEEFDDRWICPNPQCGHTLPAKNFKMLVRNHKSCPYCKAKYITTFKDI